MLADKQLTISIVLLFISVSFGHVTNNSSADKKSNWRQKMVDMDKLHVVRLEKKILELLRIEDMPKLNKSQIAARWKRKVEEASVVERTLADESEKTLRKYELEVLGKKRGQVKNTDSRVCSREFTYEVKLFPENGSQTLLEKAYIDVPKNCSLEIVQFREISPDSSKSSSFNSRRLEELASDGRKTFHWKTFDISSFLYPFWKVDGKNFGLKATLICAKLCDRERQNDRDQIEATLKLSLRETKSLGRVSSCSSIFCPFYCLLFSILTFSFIYHAVCMASGNSDHTKRQVSNKGMTVHRRRQKSSSGAPNCDDMWDQDFFREVPQGLYNDFVGGGCCQRHFEIDFARIGWDNWVISPPSIRSSYCLGRCQSYGFNVDRN
uniref:TGF-beta family profile domain-containing protein n=1 Tax=Romanomermis culicivorax TaxID=13658 RepID=A0A915KA40_ROMCU